MSTKSRGLQGEKKVKTQLVKFKEYHKVLNDITFVVGKNEMSHQIDHILIHPHGVFVIETKNYYGEIISDTNDSFWLKIINGTATRISNPIKQNKGHARVINTLLKGKYEVIPVVVFVKNNAPYVEDDNVINMKDLRLMVESHPYQKLLEKEDIDFIYKTLKGEKSKISKAEHLENIHYLKEVKEEFRLEMAYAIERHRCPRCEHDMKIEGNNWFCTGCDFKFKL